MRRVVFHPVAGLSYRTQGTDAQRETPAAPEIERETGGMAAAIPRFHDVRATVAADFAHSLAGGPAAGRLTAG
jgi:hypothetical protein